MSARANGAWHRYLVPVTFAPRLLVDTSGPMIQTREQCSNRIPPLMSGVLCPGESDAPCEVTACPRHSR